LFFRILLRVKTEDGPRRPEGLAAPARRPRAYAPLLPTNYAFDDEPHETGCVATMPDASGLRADETEIAAYEIVSEGTPISPVFPNTSEGTLALVNYCAEHATTFGDYDAGAEAWAAVLFGGASVDLDGTVRTYRGCISRARSSTTPSSSGASSGAGAMSMPSCSATRTS
jgi:hypothetical protein